MERLLEPLVQSEAPVLLGLLGRMPAYVLSPAKSKLSWVSVEVAWKGDLNARYETWGTAGGGMKLLKSVGLTAGAVQMTYVLIRTVSST